MPAEARRPALGQSAQDQAKPHHRQRRQPHKPKAALQPAQDAGDRTRHLRYAAGQHAEAFADLGDSALQVHAHPDHDNGQAAGALRGSRLPGPQLVEALQHQQAGLVAAQAGHEAERLFVREIIWKFQRCRRGSGLGRDWQRAGGQGQGGQCRQQKNDR